eukprot:403367949
MDDEQFKLFEQMTEFTREFHEACDNIAKVEKEITKELQKQINISRKPQDLPEMYSKSLQPMNMVRKKLWYRLYKYWHEPFIEKNYDDDKLLLLKQQNAYKKRMKKRQMEKKLQNSKLSGKGGPNNQSLNGGKGKSYGIQNQSLNQKEGQDGNDSDSVDLEMLIQEQKKQANQNDESNLTAEFMNGEDDPDNDEMAQIISKKVDPFNINHKKNQNLYRDTLLECIGLKPHKLIKNISLPQFYVRQHKKQRKSQFQKRDLYDNFIQVCDPNKKRVKETKELIQEQIIDYIQNIQDGINEKLNYLKQLESVQQEIVSKSKKLENYDCQTDQKLVKTIKIEKTLTPGDYEEVYFNQRRMKQMPINLKNYLSAPNQKKSLISRRASKLGSPTSQGSYQNIDKLLIPLNQISNYLQPSTIGNTPRSSFKITTPIQNMKTQRSPLNRSINNSPKQMKKEFLDFNHYSQLNAPKEFIETKMPKYAQFNDKQIKFQLRKFHERIEKSSWKTENNLAFQESRANRLNYPCLHTGTLLEKASEALKSKVAQAKIIKINKANQQEWIDQDAKTEKLNKIANGFIELDYDLDEEKQKYINQIREDMDSQDMDALDALNRSLSNDDELSLKDFQAIAKEIKMTRLKSKESPKKQKPMSQLTTRRQSIGGSVQSSMPGLGIGSLKQLHTARYSMSTAQNSRYDSRQIKVIGVDSEKSITTSHFIKRQVPSVIEEPKLSKQTQEDIQRANEVFGVCKTVLQESSTMHRRINTRENKINSNFDTIKDRVSHNIQLGEDDIKMSVEDFHNKKHIFIYNKDLSKGYFLRLDPNRINEIARRLHTFKFKEPRIVAEEDKEAEILEKQRLEKYFHKRFKSDELDAKSLRPKFTEKFIARVQAVTKMCSLKIKDEIDRKQK